MLGKSKLDWGVNSSCDRARFVELADRLHDQDEKSGKGMEKWADGGETEVFTPPGWENPPLRKKRLTDWIMRGVVQTAQEMTIVSCVTLQTCVLLFMYATLYFPS